MIDTLRKKLIIFTMLALICIMTLIFGAVNIANIYRTYAQTDELINLIADNGGIVPGYSGIPEYSYMDKETEFETRYFTVRIDNFGNPVEVNLGHIASVTESEAVRYAQDIKIHKKTKGFKGVYRYIVTKTDNGGLIVFLNCRAEQQQIAALLLISGSVVVISILVIFIVLCLVSTRVISPIAESMEKQKQFITDAGHELKTPLAVINANTEVLEMLNGENEWTNSIKNQITRLNELIKGLLHLAKMEEKAEETVFEDFNLSKAVQEVAEPFKTMAIQKNKKFDMHIQPDIIMNGDENGIKTLVSVLTDNAIKYAPESGLIDVSVSQHGKTTKIEVRNTDPGTNETELNRLFDRFYRADSSRSRETGGFGIGLSIARTIVESHKGKISAFRENKNIICFSAVFINR